MRRAPLIAIAAALVACSLIVDLGDLSTTVSDAASDASASDARFCAGDAHLFCEDFDNGAWSAKLQPVMNGATLSVASDDHVSSPASLRIEADASSASGYLLATLPQPLPSDFVCTLSLRIEGIDSGFIQAANVVLFATDPNVNTYALFFQGDPLTGQLYEFEQTTDGGLTDNPKTLPYSVVDGAWHRIALAVHLGAATAEMTLDEGLTTTRSISPPQTVTGASFAIGIRYSSAPAGWTAHFDDAVCDKL